MIMCVGLFGQSAVVFPVFMFCHVFSCFVDCLCGCVFFRWHFIDLFSCIAASLFNKLTYLLKDAFAVLRTARCGVQCERALSVSCRRQKAVEWRADTQHRR